MVAICVAFYSCEFPMQCLTVICNIKATYVCTFLLLYPSLHIDIYLLQAQELGLNAALILHRFIPLVSKIITKAN